MDGLETNAPRPRQELVWVELDGCTVVYDEVTLRMHVLDIAATAVWQRLDGQTILTDVVRSIARQFAADQRQVAEDVTALVAHFAHEALLHGTTPTGEHHAVVGEAPRQFRTRQDDGS